MVVLFWGCSPIALAVIALTALVTLPRSRMCVTENHVPCFRDYRQLSAMRRLVRGFRVAVGFVWLVMLTLWLVLLVDGQPLSVLGIWVGAWVAAVAVLWTKLAWPVELERRRVQLERDADVPWDVIR